MIIQLNTDKNISGNEKFEHYLDGLVKDELRRFSEHITRIEVHLADENGAKNGENDKRCMIEARLENKQPITVTCHANTIEKAVDDGLSILKSSIEKLLKKD